MSEEDKNEKEPKNKPTYKQISQERAKETSVARKIFIIILLALILVIGIGGYSLYSYIDEGVSPVDPNSDETIEITIPLGSGSSDIANILEEAGVINNSLIYRFYIKFNNAADFQAGDYTLTPAMSLAEITEELQTGSVREESLYRVTVPEGRKIEEIAVIYEENANISQEDFLAKMKDTQYIENLVETYPDILTEEILHEDIIYPLEGYLFPATYEFFDENPSIESVVKKMLDKTSQVVSAYYESIDEHDLSMHEIITLTSLVEEEAPSEEDRKMITRVFLNRMEEDMQLQTDPTVIYAHGEHISRLTYADYEIESPYNTYHVSGLPVGPISNFGESSLIAVLEPASPNNYLFFLADSDGEVYYSTSYEEHQELEEKYIHNQD